MAVNPDILREMDVPSDAVIETWDSITAKTVILGRQILDFCEPEAPSEVYDLMAAMPRGAYHPVNILSRAFGYGSTNIIHPVSPRIDKAGRSGPVFGMATCRHLR